MSYRLFTRTNCSACTEVQTFMENASINFDLVDLDTENNTSGGDHVKIVPALFMENRLMAYGSDIITYITSLNKIARSA